MATNDDHGTRFGSESQISQPDLTRLGFIEQVEDLLFGGARARDIKDVVIGELYYLRDALPSLSRRLRLPLAQSSVQFLRQSIHDDLLPSLLV